MDFTTIIDFFLQVITKSQIENLFVRLNITGYTDFEVLLVWIFTAIIIDAIILFASFTIIKKLVIFITEGIGYL